MLKFKNLEFNIQDGKIFITKCGNLENLNSPFAEVHIAGENKDTHMGAKMVLSSEGRKLTYVNHEENGNTLKITQKSELVEVTTTFFGFDDTNAFSVNTSVKNISDSAIVLEEVSAFILTGLPLDSYFTRFIQSHHKECQPICRSFADWGLETMGPNSQKRLSCANVGSWSTKEELPQGIIADKNYKGLMFQIESNNSWYYEISDTFLEYYLYLGGPNISFGSWSKKLEKNESYTTVTCALAFGDNLNDIIGNMTLYRRHIEKNYISDENLPTIFNEYMHFSWDSPTAENTAMLAPVVAKTGVEYYVIDCGWHNEEPGNIIYPYVGQWIESNARFPEGVRKTTDFIRSLGMKPGLWIEPEVIGNLCKDMLEYYDDDCFLQRYGKKITIGGRHFLDFRNEKVRAYLNETIDRMVNEYGADYIKFDYNQDCGVGTDYAAFCAAVGLEEASDAFIKWINEIHERHPNVVFEGCSSGGLRMDHKSLAAFSLFSTSDQTKYDKYPYIAGNILSAVLPEQAAVWSYPVTEDCEGPDVSLDRIAVNMINSFLGRMHLASHLERLNDEQISLIKEGVDYYNSLTEAKKQALPYFPCGFTHFGAEEVCAGLKTDDKIYLAVWNLGDAKEVDINIPELKNVKIAYPSNSDVKINTEKATLKLSFPRSCMAVFLEIEI